MRQSPLASRSGTEIIAGQSGYVLPLILLWSVVLALQILGVAMYSASSARGVGLQEHQIQAFYLADAAVEKTSQQIRLFIQNNGMSPVDADLSSMEANPPALESGFSYDDVSVSYQGAATLESLSLGDYQGLNASRRTIRLSAAVDPPDGNAPPVTVTQTVDIQFIPVFQFGIFYQNDLEFGPGQNMTFAGAVHTNSDLYVTADNGVSISFDSSVTSAKGIYHKLKEGGSETGVQGDVMIKDLAGTYQNMKNGTSDWLDSNNDAWFDDSQTRWGGKVKATDHGTHTLSLPISAQSAPHDIIERRNVGTDTPTLVAQKLDYKAHLRIIDNVVQNQAGATVELPYCTPGVAINTHGTPSWADDTCSSGSLVNPISAKSFTDKRELKTIKATEIDVAKLNASPVFAALVAANNGLIVYFSDLRNQGAGTENALRLINGSTLPVKGVTFAAQNPVYVKGDYNTVSKKPSGIASDSFNLLSNAWNDANSGLSVSNRVASNTTVNTAVMTGNIESTSGHYNGGLENIHRLLENWSGKTLTYKGSIVVLHNSETGVAQWGNADVYSPPARNWSFDASFLTANYTIPGFPSVYNIIDGTWSHD